MKGETEEPEALVQALSPHFTFHVSRFTAPASCRLKLTPATFIIHDYAIPKNRSPRHHHDTLR